MALAHAIMSALVNCPRSGYDLTKYLEGSIGFFWKASHQQIYRELNKLEEKDCVESEEVAQVGRPDKKLYCLTDKGRQTLIQWLGEPCDVVSIKDDLLVKVFVGHLVPGEVIQNEIARHRQMHVEKLAIYRDIEQEFFSNPQELNDADVFPYLTLRNGIMDEESWISWCEESLALLASRIPRQ